MAYYQFCKKHFEYELRGILIRNKLGFMKDITEEWMKENGETWERIYSVSTKNRAVDVIIFSSLDVRTNEVRDKGDDAVRVVLRWKTGNSYRYKKVHKHLRLATLFNNLEKTLTNIHPFGLNIKEFTPAEEIA